MVGSKITSAFNVSGHPENQHHACSNTNSIRSMSATKTSTSVTRLAICLVVLLSLLEVTNAQNVHFSNGWYPGKKRSSSSSSSAIPGAANSPLIAATASSSSGSPGAFSACSVRPDLGEIINKVIMEEMVRLHSSCLFGIPRDLREILEGAVNKQTKW